MNRIRSIVISTPVRLGVDSHGSERTVDAGGAIAHLIYARINRWTESDALDRGFEKPQKAQVVSIKIEAVSLDSTSMAPSLDGPLLPDAAGQLGAKQMLARVEADVSAKRLTRACRWQAG